MNISSILFIPQLGKAVPGGLLITLAFALLMVGPVFGPNAQAQSTVDYDVDDDALIDVDTLARLNAIRWDLDGDGTTDDSTNATSYATAFPNAMTGMGCPSDGCTGYELTANLDFDGSSWASGAGWEPIGSSATSAFAATFDGGAPSYEISNLYINRPSTASAAGLFGYTATGSEIRNVELDDVDITAVDYVGALVGQSNSEITDSKVTGTVNGRWYIGGLAALNDAAITNSTSSATVTSNSTGGVTGGLVGLNRYSITNSHSTGAVSGVGWTGGLVGWNQHDISGSSAGGTVTATDQTAGGLVGYNDVALVEDSHASGAVSGTQYVGGLIGSNSASTIDRSAASGRVTATGDYVGGLVGWNDDGIRDSYASGAVRSDGNKVGGLVGENAVGGFIYDSRADGNVGDSTSTSSSIGGLVGQNDRGIVGSVAGGTVTSTGESTGGLIGWNRHRVEWAVATGSVSGSTKVGGLAGYSDKSGIIMGSSASGTVTATGDKAGGLTGLNDGEIGGSFATGGVTGVNSVGGLVGEHGGTIKATYASGSVTASGDAGGGLVGLARKADATHNASSSTASYATGSVGGSGTNIGGFAGVAQTADDADDASFTNSYWDTSTSGRSIGVASDDADDSGSIDGTETTTAGISGKTTAELQAPTEYSGIFVDWNVTLTGRTAHSSGPWDFGGTTDYPALRGPTSPPSFPSGTATYSDAEESASGVAIGSPLTASDSDGDALSYKLVGADAVHFSIDDDTGQLRTKTYLDYENPSDGNRDNTYEFMVQAHDGKVVDFRRVTVRVTDATDNTQSPTISGSANVNHPENVTAVVTYSVSDPENADTAWLPLEGADRHRFEISSEGVLSFLEPPDHERPRDSGGDNSYEVTIEVSDGKFSATLDVTVTVTNVDEPPVIRGLHEIETNENFAHFNASFSATDPEGATTTFTWSLSGTDADDFNINSSTSVVTFKSVPDYEAPTDANTDNVYLLTVQANDGTSSDVGTFDVSITVAGVDEAPVITGPLSEDVDENSTAVIGTYSASDPEGDQVGALELSGADSGPFELNAGVLNLVEELDYEDPKDVGENNTYEVTIGVLAGTLRSTIDVTVTVMGVNEAPTILGQDQITFQERSTTRCVARYQTSDPEDDSTNWLNPSGTDAADFRINDSSDLCFINAPDFDAPHDSNTDNIYLVTITASDGSLSDTLDVTVTVTGVDEPPDISGDSSIDVPEGTTGTIETYSAVDPEGEVVTWEPLTGDDGDLFNFDSSDGALSFKSAPDFEDPQDSGKNNEYLVNVNASDGEKTGTLSLTVTVTDVNEPPTVTGQEALSFPENSVRSIATYQAIDPEEGPITWSVAGTDDDDFNISQAGVLAFASIPDFENPVDANQDNDYRVTVEATDDDNNTGTLDVIVTVTNSTGTEEPTITTTSNPSPYRENGTGAVYTFRARDPQGQPTSWSLSGTDGHVFQISSGGVLTFRSPPDFENPTDADGDNVYEITVIATDNQSLTDKVHISVTVINDAEGVEPTISTRRPPSTYRENGTSTVYTFRASDPQGGTITWTLEGTDASDFTITRDSSGRGQLSFNSSPDFENPVDSDPDNVYELTVVATDEDGHKDKLAFSITVTDVNEGPEISRVGNAPGSVPENQSQGQVLARYTATDPENPTIQISNWSTSGTDGGDFLITGLGELRFRNTPDFERPVDSNRDNVYVFTVRAYDGRVYGIFDETVTVTPVNEPPTITTTSTSATALQQSENRTSRLYTYRATDPEASEITWSVGGTDGRFFTIDERGQFSFNEANPPNYEQPGDDGGNNRYDVTVEATDDDNNTTPLEVLVRVTNINEGPEVTRIGNLIGNPPGSVPENHPQETVLAGYTATDPEGGSISRWRTSGTDGGDFTIDENGQLTFRSVPDYERPADSNRDNTYVFTVQASDGSIYGSFEETVVVTAVNEPPTITTTSTSATTLRQPENRASRLYTYRATDPEGANTITWSVDRVDARLFTIDQRGQFSFNETNPPDYEQPGDSGRDNVYNVLVQATDDDNNTAPLNVTITVSDVNEGPEVTGGGDSFDVQENRDWPGASFTASDPEGGSITRWALGGRDAGDFTITGTGVMTFRSVPDYERPADSDRDNVYEVEVRPYDGRYYGSHHVTVTVEDVNEVTGPATLNRAENFDGVLGTYSAVGRGDLTVDPGWSLRGTDGGDFTIDETGQLTFRSVPDYERPADSNRDNTYVFTVRATDDRYYGTLDVEVVVTAVNEPPTITTTSTSATTLRQPENRASRLYTYRATDPEGANTITWSVDRVDARLFTIDQRGQFSFNETNPPDYEQPGDSGRDNVYNVLVQATDDDNNTAPLNVTITVSDVNEGPEVTGGGDSFDVQENRDWPGASFTASDPEGGSITRWALGGRDAGDFTITGTGVMTFRSVPDYERPADSDRDNVYEVEVRPYDGRYYGSHHVTVTVEDVNEVTGPATLNRAENFDGVLGTYSAVGRGDLTVDPGWSLRGTDGGDFTIDETGQLTFRSVPDYERPADSNRDNTYVFTVRATDDRYYGTLDVEVVVTAVNEHGPVIRSGSRTSFTYREEETSAIYTYSASDGDRDDVITWTATGVDGDIFEFTDRNALLFKVPPDYESPGDSGKDHVYNLNVVATDSGGRSDSLGVTVSVTDVNEGPEVSGPPTLSIDENQDLSNAVYSATDPEGGNVASWRLGGRDGGDLLITQGGTLYFRNLPDYERPADSNRDNVYELLVQPSDGRNTGSLAVTLTVNDVNERPEMRSGSRTSFTQPENRVSRLYTFSATDPEKGEITWSVGGADGSHFTIDERGEFSFREDSPPDFDSPADVGEDNLYNVTIQARDPESNTASLLVAVMVTEVNEGPEIIRNGALFGNPPGTVPENYAVTQVLATYTATDPERPGVAITQWSTAGRDGGDFEINALGQLMFRNSPDYERPADSNRDNVYEVTIRASDGRYTGMLEEVQIVTVTNENESPTITTTSRTAFSQQENRTSTLYTFRATDPEGETVSWAVTGTDSSFFHIDGGGALSFSNPPDFDSPGDVGSDNVYNVTVEARDAGFNTDTLVVTVTVTDHNEGVEPTITTRRPPSTYRENDTRTVYTFLASDPQRGTITWTLEGIDDGDFRITTESSGRGILAFASPPDFESPDDSDGDNEYELSVVATDDEGHSERVDFTITVTDHDEGVEPTISTRRPPSTYRENDTRTIYTFRASDPQREPITWSVTGTDASAFTITPYSSDRGVLTFSSPPDFESPVDSNQDNEYELGVVVTDVDSHTDRVEFTITITDVNEGPEISLGGTAKTTVPENKDVDTVLADYDASDPENPGVSIFRWSTAGRDGGDFLINELGELRFRNSPDFERPADSNRDNVYEVIARAYDGRSYGMLEDPLVVTVTQVNEAPVITTKSRTEFALQENSTSNIYTYRATDQDRDDGISWSVEGPEEEDFAIYDGVLNFRLLPDFEIPSDSDEDNAYRVTVVATDSGGLRDTVDALVTITDQAEGPVIAGATSYTVEENYDISRVVGSYTATDAKDGRPVHPQWSLAGRDGGDLVIDRATGALSFRNTPDYDRPADSNRDNVYEFTVRGHDSRAYGSLNVTVTVTDINEHSPVVTGRQTLSFRENTTAETRLYAYRATDGDRDTSLTWSLEGDDGDDFAINEGVLTFGTPPDYEQPADSDADNVYQVTVVASDGNNRGTLEVTVTVTESNEGPVVSGTAAFTINENQDLSNAVYTAIDPEAIGGVSTTFTWSTSGRDGGDFTIDRDSGVLTFRTPPDYERPADSNRDNIYEFTVRAHDGRNYGYFDVVVTVEDVAEITGPAVLTQAENFQGVLATYSAAGQGILVAEPEWRLTGTDRGDFNINDEGELTFRSVPDHERPADSNRDNIYDLLVQVSDGSYYDTLEVTVTVTPENEPPAITGRDSLSFRENTPVTARLYTYRATDPEGDAFTWDLGGLDASDFEISEQGVLTFASPPDFDSPGGSGTDANQYLVTVQAEDSHSNTGEFLVTVAVTDQNEGAVVTGQDVIAVQENRDPSLVLATYSATDPEGQNITRWSLSGSDSGDFLINENGDLTFRDTPDYDRPADSNRDNEYRVSVRAYDGRTYGSLDVIVTVSNVNEHTPAIQSGSRTSFTYREEGTSVLYTYRATDGDKDDVITWTTGGADGNLFEFNDRNGLEFRNPPDYENPGDSGGNNEYELTVVATDSGGLSDSLPVTVTITELNEGPEVAGTTTYTVAENQDLSGATFTATDPEDPSAAVTSWRLAGSDAGDFTITDTSQQTGQNTAELTFRSTPDYDRPADSNRNNEYLVTIRAYNGGTYGSLDVTVTVTDQNEAAPVVSGRDSLSFRENTPPHPSQHLQSP